ncbi:Tripartite motif-containing protein [Schistosoma japonicum]|uniref:Tripartite motif-containing protein n=1 Tax=Schistosoma japonicum TaxID=6182 RepID=A0A4Z2DNI5_SCHJA|nr:Tripartite motif-containing protein [Schistosoma japonicum]
MPGDNQHQSAYRYRHTRHGLQHDVSGPNTKSPSPKQCEDALAESLPRIDTARLTNDPFLGTVAGRLAQEIHDEFLVCKICFDSYTNPKCLACLHTFCAKCIEKHISAEVTYNKYTDYRDFTCPLCRKRTQLPLGGVKRLPDNFLISGLTDLVLRQRASSNGSSTATIVGSPNTCGINSGIDERQVSAAVNESNDSLHQLPNLESKPLRYGECEICSQVSRSDRGHSSEPLNKVISSEINSLANNTDNYNSNNQQRASSAHLNISPKATSKCLDCNKLLCDECVQRHRNTKVTKDHATFELQSHSDIECKDHPGETVRFYCEACSTCICVLCTFNAHREHEVTSFGEAVTKLRHEISRNLDIASQRIGKVQSQLHNVREAASIIHRIEQRIHDTVEHFIEEIQQQEQELISELHQFVGECNMHHIHNQPDQEQHVEIAESLFKDIANSLDNQDMELLLVRTNLYEKITELNQIELITNKFDPMKSEIYFRPGSVNLGYLTNEAAVNGIHHQNDVDDEDDDDDDDNYEDLSIPLECNSSSSSSATSSSIELANRPCINSTACQTDISITDTNDQNNSNVHQFQNLQQAPKQFRTRACNTELISMTNQETNTRPRGVHTIITFSDISSNAASEEFLARIDKEKIDLNEMDNLTRARIRRKLHERFNTVDQISNGNNVNGVSCSASHAPIHFASNGPSPASTNQSMNMNNTTTYNNHKDTLPRRYSSYDKRFHF